MKASKNEERVSIFENIKKAQVVIAVILGVGTILTTLLSINNSIILSKLQPLQYDIDKIRAEEVVVKADLSRHQDEQETFLKSLATKSQIEDLTTRVDKISSRVDLILSKLIK